MLFVRDTPETESREVGSIFQANAKKQKASSTIHIKQNRIQGEIYQEGKRGTVHIDRKSNSLRVERS